MPPRGALWNWDTASELARLSEVVAKARLLPLPAERAMLPRRRPGWAGKLVLEVLQEANAPMNGGEVKRAIEQRTGNPMHKDTVLHALKFSAAAKRGIITRTPDGRYILGSS